MLTRKETMRLLCNFLGKRKKCKKALNKRGKMGKLVLKMFHRLHKSVVHILKGDSCVP